MAYPKDGSPPITVFSDKTTPGTVSQVGPPRTSAPALRIDTSSQPLSAAIPNPYAGFEITLQRYPLQDKPSSSQQQHSRQPGPPNQRQDQQHGRPQHQPQQGQSDPRRQQTTRPPPKEFYSRRHQRLRAQNPQQIRGPTWGKIRRDDKFPPPVPPASISPHPDHSMYPSYKFIQPNFGIVHDYQRPLQTPVTAVTGSSQTASSQAQITHDPEPLTAISLASGDPLPFRSSSPLPVELIQAKRSRPPSQTHESYSHPLPLRQQIVSKRQKRTHLAHNVPQQIEPSAHTSNPIQLHPPPPPPPQSPSSSGSDEHETVLEFPMPPPPHPSANFFPFLRPVPASQRRGSQRTTAKPSSASPSQHGDTKGSDTPRMPAPSHDVTPGASRVSRADTDEAETLPQTASRLNLKAPRLNLPQRRPQTSGSITPSMSTPRASTFAHHSVSFDSEGILQDEEPHNFSSAAREHNSQHGHNNSRKDMMPPDINSLVLPYGNATPVVRLLNQSPFVDIIRGVVADARSHPTPRRDIQPARQQGEDDSFQRSFDSAISLSHDATLHPAVPSLSHRPLFRLPHTEPPNASHLTSCVEKYSTHIQALYHIMPLRRLDHLVMSFLHRYETAEQQQQGNVADHDPFQLQVELAIEYLVFALGGLCWAKWDNTIFDSGPVFSDRATNILYHLSGKLASDKRKHASNLASSNLGRQAHGPHDRAHSDTADPNNVAASTRAQINSRGAEITQQLSHPTGAAGGAASVPAPTLDLARAYLLAALLCGQLARIQDAAGHVRNAGNIIQILIHRPGGEGGPGAIQGFYGLSLVDYKQYPHKLVEDERQLVALYWTCVQLEFEINAETGQPPSELLRYQAMVPTPDLDILRFPHHNGEDTMMAGTELLAGCESEYGRGAIGGFIMQTILRGHLNNIYSEAYGQHGGRQTQEQKHNVKMAVANLRQQFDAVLLGRTTLPHTEDSVRKARTCSAYWEARSYGVLPSLLKPQQQVDMDEMAEVVCSMTETVRAYHGLESDRLILPNAFGTAMLQCRYLLLLFAASRALPALAAFVDDASLAELIDHTLLSFQELLMFRSILEAARQVLRTIRAALQPHGSHGSQTRPGLCDPIMAPTVSGSSVLHGPGPMPELSLYCPPFTTVPGIASSIPTASTMDSFISFPTPNSPHLFPSSAFTSPQHSPSISATSSSPSPRSATFVSASMPFRPETMAALASASGSGSMSPGAFYPRPPDSTLSFGSSLPVPPERIPASTADFDSFVYHLGLSSLWGQG